MEHVIKKVLFSLIALVVSSASGSAQQITVYHGATAADAASILTYGIQHLNTFFQNQAGPGLYVTTDYNVALNYANAAAEFAASQGATGAQTQPYVLEMVLDIGAAKVGNFEFDAEALVSNFGKGILSNLVQLEAGTQAQLGELDVVNVLKAGYTGAAGETSYMIIHSSAEAYLGVANPVAADLSMVPTGSYVAQAQQTAQNFLSRAGKMFVGNGSALNSDAIELLENTGEMTAQAVKNCSWFCGAAAAIYATANNLKIGLNMYADNLTNLLIVDAGMGSVTSASGVFAGVSICDNTLDNLCSTNINTSVSYLLFGPNAPTGPTLLSQTINVYTGSVERDYSDGSTTWNWNTGIVSGITAAGVGYVMDPGSGVVASATPVDGLNLRTSQILAVTWPDVQTEYLTQAGFSDTLDNAKAAVGGISLLNSPLYQYPALFQVPAVMPILDQSGMPAPVQQNSDGTVTTTGTTPDGTQFTKTVQKDSSGNVVSVVTTLVGDNFTTSRNDLTGTSMTILRNPDGSTSFFNCIQGGTVCATDSGIINYNDGWNGNNPYDVSNQAVSPSVPNATQFICSASPIPCTTHYQPIQWRG